MRTILASAGSQPATRVSSSRCSTNPMLPRVSRTRHARGKARSPTRTLSTSIWCRAETLLWSKSKTTVPPAAPACRSAASAKGRMTASQSTRGSARRREIHWWRMSMRSAGRGRAAARSIRLALRSLSIVATSRASLPRWVFRCRGSRCASSASIPTASRSIPPIPIPAQPITGRGQHARSIPSTKLMDGKAPRPGLSHLGLSELGKESGEEEVVPCGAFELALHRALGGFGLGEVEGEAAQEGEVLGATVLAVPGPILIHGDVEHPMQPVLDAPVGARDLGEALGAKPRAEQVVGDLGRGLRGDLADAHDLADGGQPGPAAALLEPSDVGRDEAGAGLDAPVAAVDRGVARLSGAPGGAVGGGGGRAGGAP